MNDDTENARATSSCGCCTETKGTGSGKWIWIVLTLAVVSVLVAKNMNREPAAASAAAEVAPASVSEATPLPRLVDLGASSCIPCKAMKPILNDLMANYAGVFKTEFIDVWENPDSGQMYGIRAIPTQIFYDSAGKELFRHEGFFGKDDILDKWKELGVDLVQ